MENVSRLAVVALCVGLSIQSTPLAAMNNMQVEEDDRQEQKGLRAWVSTKMQTLCEMMPKRDTIMKCGVLSISATLTIYLIWCMLQEHCFCQKPSGLRSKFCQQFGVDGKNMCPAFELDVWPNQTTYHRMVFLDPETGQLCSESYEGQGAPWTTLAFGSPGFMMNWFKANMPSDCIWQLMEFPCHTACKEGPEHSHFFGLEYSDVCEYFLPGESFYEWTTRMTGLLTEVVMESHFAELLTDAVVEYGPSFQ